MQKKKNKINKGQNVQRWDVKSKENSVLGHEEPQRLGVVKYGRLGNKTGPQMLISSYKREQFEECGDSQPWRLLVHTLSAETLLGSSSPP